MTDKTREEFEAACTLLPEGVAWGALLTPEIARGIAQAALATKAAPEPHRWNIEPQPDGSLLVCKNLHDKGDKCEYVHYVQATPPPAPPQEPPEGWVLVPREPTAGMVAAYQEAFVSERRFSVFSMWRAMLAALPAPTHPAQADQQENPNG